MARKKRCCVRKRRGRDGRMHCAKFKPPSKARKCLVSKSAPRRTVRKAAPKRRRAGCRRGRTELQRSISAATRLKCSNPNREARLLHIGQYIAAIGRTEGDFGVPVRGFKSTQRKVDALKRKFRALKKSVQKCAGPGTALAVRR